MRHIIFFIAYLYFLYCDCKNKEVSIVAVAMYAFVALLTIAIGESDISMSKLADMLYSVGFGLIIYMLSYFSGEGIGIADGVYFVINGFLLTLKENIVLFLTGLLVAFIIGLLIFFFSKNNRKMEMRLPFMPCCLPAIIGYIICIV